MTLYLKAPDARVSYKLDWGTRYASILMSEWRVEPDEEDGLFVVGSSFEGTVASALVEGGRAGSGYDLVNRVTLGSGEIDERSISFRVEAR